MKDPTDLETLRVSPSRAWLQTSVILFPPVFETFFLHRTLHEAFGENLFRVGIHTTDVYLPLVLGGCLGTWKLLREGSLRFALCKKAVAVNLVLFIGALSFIHFFSPLSRAASYEASCFLLLGLLILVLLSSSFLFFPFVPAWQWAKERRFQFFCGVLAVWCLVAYPLVVDGLWSYLSAATAESVHLLLRMLGVTTEMKLGEFFTLWNPRFAASMGQRCSGLEGMFFFIFAYLLLGALNPLWVRGEKRVLVVLLSGLSLMFVLNTIRITLFFVFALFLEARFPGRGAFFYAEVFHTNVGWILYSAGLLLFFHFWRNHLEAAVTAGTGSACPMQ